MQGLVQRLQDQHPDLSRGVQMATASGQVHISPLRRAGALHIASESYSMEAATELCDAMERLAREIDGGIASH